MLLADAFPSGYHATELARVSTGDSVAVFGAGAIGLLAAYSARLRGASDIYVVDNVRERLDKASQMASRRSTSGWVTRSSRSSRNATTYAITAAAWLGEEPLIGVTRGIDAIGFQARDRDDPSKEHPLRVIEALSQLVVPGGRRAIIGVFLDIVSHHVSIEGAPDAYRHFDERRDGYLKVVPRPS